jgi:protein SCO1/2
MRVPLGGESIDGPAPGGALPTNDRGVRWAMVSLVGIVAVTVAWWSLALWPSQAVPPTWLLRTRQVCFNAGPSGLPGPSGWMLLIGQPLGMVALLMAVAGGGVREGLQSSLRSFGGRLALTLGVTVSVVGLTLAGLRVAGDSGEGEWVVDATQISPDSYPRLDRELPSLGLVDQWGNTVSWEQFQGGPVLLTFGFGHCATVCPLIVHEAVGVQETFRAEGTRIPLVVVTLDPWRDTPARLPHLAEQFMLGEDAFFLSGSTSDVNRVLDGLEVPRERDLTTGDIVHPSLAFLVDDQGRIAFGASGHARLMEALMRRVQDGT